MNNKQQGVVSLFIVIFTTLLLTVLVVGFVRLMVQEQIQATNRDLSQSAYDSAVSGVADAKRVIRACDSGVQKACTAITSQQCDTVSAAGVVPSAGTSTETIIQANGATTNLNQGYTCVIIHNKADDFLGNLTSGASQLVPIKVVAPNGSPDTITSITIEWMHQGASYSGGEPSSLSSPTALAGTTLPTQGGWNPNAPAMLRVQAVLPTNANSVTTAELDSGVASTIFLRPATVSAAQGTTATFTVPTSRATAGQGQTTTPVAVACSNAGYQAGDYACKVTLTVPPVPTESAVAFLRVTSLYRDTSFRVTVAGKANPSLQFDGVQPVVDSTGRASNMFRRISSRLDLSPAILPPAAIDITGSICKDFYVTDNQTPAQVPPGVSCNTAP